MEDIGIHERIILKMDVKYTEGYGLDWINLVQGGDKCRSRYEVGNESSGSVKCWKFLK